ncbi:MAG TPA: globin domain-containing protein, partial [Flavisolibacter sp.]|nr:globin domain-containing protein [Flavisolibacter sp.]
NKIAASLFNLKIAIMTPYQVSLVKETWLSVTALDPVIVGDLFYQKLFEICPEVRPMFTSSLPEQSKKLLYMLNYIISKLHKLEDVVEDVQNLARRHVHYGVKASHYTAVATALLWTLEQGLGKAWTEEVDAAWTACYTTLADAMIQASAVYQENVSH